MISTKIKSPEIDLSTCDREKIQMIGAIQDHGYFFAFRRSDRTLYHGSENISRLIGVTSKEVIGKSLTDIFGESTAHRIWEISEDVKADHPEFLRVHGIGSSTSIFDFYLFDFDGLIAVEIEEINLNDHDAYKEMTTTHRRSRNFIEKLHASQTLTMAARLACSAIREVTGFDRVMMYRYLPNWDGEVIAEDKSPEAHSFLHHRFPASDIPLPARQLYLKNRSRQISDSKAGTAQIEPALHYLTRKPIDLTHSKLRAVSPIHLVYLQNMGVRSSFSLAVIVDQNLWGLIACHGKNPMVISHEARLSCESIASTFSVLANMIENLETKSAKISFEEKMKSFWNELQQSPNPLKLFMQKHTTIEDLFSATGVAFSTRDRVEVAGLTPPLEQTRELATQIRERLKIQNKTVAAIERLEEIDPRWSQLRDLSCGVLAIDSSDMDESLLMIFRPEVLRTVTWGGDPRKIMEKRAYQGPINPRTSFESWTETVSGHSSKWKSFEIQGAMFLRDFVFEILVRKERLIQDLGHQLNFSKSDAGKKG